jgi:hypothetical protein
MPKNELWEALVADYEREKKHLHAKGEPVQVTPDGQFKRRGVAQDKAGGLDAVRINSQTLLVSMSDPRVLAGLYLRTYGGDAPQAMESASSLGSGDAGTNLPWTHAIELVSQAVDAEIRATLIDQGQNPSCSVCGGEGKEQLWRWKFRNAEGGGRVWCCPICFVSGARVN